MNKGITIEGFNVLPFNEKLGYIVRMGELIRSDDHEIVYRVLGFHVRAVMEWSPLRITSCEAFDPNEATA